MEHNHEHDLDLHDDDEPVGRVLTRREVLGLIGGAMGSAILVGTGLTKINVAGAQGTPTPTATSAPIPTPTSVPACVAKPALTEGPYFVDAMLNRSDIRTNTEGDEIVVDGTLLKLTFRVTELSADACTPLPGAQVDIWHCDATGAYSGVNDPGFDTSDQQWLRGYQVTDENGLVEFYTIYPGWYSGRAVHIHFKIRLLTEDETQTYEFTSQLFFTPEANDEAHSVAPYNAKGMRDTLNVNDSIYQGSNGVLTLEPVAFEDEKTGEKGYEALFDIALDLENPPAEVNNGGGPGNGGPGGNGRPPGRN